MTTDKNPIYPTRSNCLCKHSVTSMRTTVTRVHRHKKENLKVGICGREEGRDPRSQTLHINFAFKSWRKTIKKQVAKKKKYILRDSRLRGLNLSWVYNFYCETLSHQPPKQLKVGQHHNVRVGRPPPPISPLTHKTDRIKGKSANRFQALGRVGWAGGGCRHSIVTRTRTHTPRTVIIFLGQESQMR